MKVEVRQIDLAEVDTDLVAVGLYDDGALPSEIAAAPGAADAKGKFKKLSPLYPESPGRVIIVGLGKREEMDAERARVVAALAAREAGRIEASSLAWALPESEDDDATAEGLVTGTILGSYRFDRFLSKDPGDPPPAAIESLTLLGPESVAAAAPGPAAAGYVGALDSW